MIQIQLERIIMDDSKLNHFSDTPWSDYTSSDYTNAQWHRACLIHQHVGLPISKGQCKLPIRVPDGAVNVNGVFAAAAALDGARGGVKASADEKANAAKTLIGIYKVLNHEPPPALITLTGARTITHHGVMGMKWGVTQASPGASKSEKKVVKADTKWAKKTLVPRNSIKVYNTAADAMNNTHIQRINNKPEYKGKDLVKPSALRDKYYKEYEKTFSAEIEKAGTSLGTSASGNYKVESWLEKGQMLPDLRIISTNVKHADTYSITITLVRDTTGHIISISIPETETVMAQGETVDEVLAHYGVQGMHWGVRKNTESTPVTMKERKAGKRLKPKGGKGHPATADATRHAIARQTARKSSTDALSDQELKALVNRMNMEQQYNRMRPDPGGMGKRFVGKLLGSVGSQQATNTANTIAAEKIKKSLIKHAIIAAV